MQNIKQEKATPEQWLKMIEKNGGLKAGEDKWLGLSDWLKASTAKTLTKDEVLKYITENDIQIEEVSYSETNAKLLDRVGELTNELYYVDESINNISESISRGKRRLKGLLAEKKAFDDKAEALKQEYGEDSPEYKNHIFYDSYTDDIESLEASIAKDEEYYAYYNGRAEAYRAELDDLNAQIGDEREINETRLNYTTQGLSNKREIALTVPTIEPWNTDDNIHFGDAGEGRAVAWIRFGETTTPSNEYSQAKTDVDNYLAKMREKYNATMGDETDYMTSEEVEQLQSLTAKEIDASDNKQRVLVIDEIQSKRHQEGREKGYNNPRVIKIFTRLAEIESNLYSQGISMEMQTEREALKAELESIFEKENPVMKSLAEQIEEKKSKRTELIKEKMNEVDEKAEIYRLREKQNQVRNVRDYDDYEAEISKIEDRIEQRHEDIDLLNSNILGLELEYGRLYNTEIRNARIGVSPAPFEKNWAEFAFKRMLRYAAENGYDYVAWTTGDQQAERYGIGNVVDRIQSNGIVDYDSRLGVDLIKQVALYIPNDTITLRLTPEGIVRASDQFNGSHITDIVGKEIGNKIMSEDSVDLRGQELRIGGEGMRGFYDQMLPSFVKKYTKKWGAEVKDITMPELEENNTMHAVNITDTMRESVMQGQPKFSLRSFEAVTEYLKFEARHWGVATPIMVVETVDEYIRLLKQIGVQDAEEYRKTAGVYDPAEDAIYIRADISDVESAFYTVLLHENTHAVTSKLRVALKDVLQTLDTAIIEEYRDVKLDKVYKNHSPIDVLDEIISYFVEEIPRQDLFDYFNDEWELEDSLLSEDRVDAIADEQRKMLVKALLPVIKKNLEKQKRNYHEKQGTPIVIARPDYGQSRGKNAQSDGSNLAAQKRGYNPRGASEAQRGASQEVGAQAGQSRGLGEVGSRLSLRTDNLTEEEAYKATLLEEAMRMERDATSKGVDIAQEIADRTGWVHLANGNWKYYGEGKVALTNEDAALRAAFRWLKAKKAIKKARNCVMKRQNKTLALVGCETINKGESRLSKIAKCS